MQTTLRVQRFNPEHTNPSPYYQNYVLEVEPSDSVLDALIRIRETFDDSLTLRCSCRGAICGSCGMRMNGQAGLACKTKILSVTQQGKPLEVEPMTNMPVIKDLVTDMGSFWTKVRQVNPWLQPQHLPSQGEYIASSEDMSRLSGVMTCIMCGVCVSDCTVLEVDSKFVGPAALAKAYRFVMDPRDAADGTRLRALNESGGMWDCTRCMECIQVCPKGVAPMERIMSLRAEGMAQAVDATCGSRHAQVFTDLVRQKGVLDEPMLAVRTFGFLHLSRLLRMIPMAFRSLRRGKVPWSGPLHRPIPGVEQIRRLFTLAERKS